MPLVKQELEIHAPNDPEATSQVAAHLGEQAIREHVNRGASSIGGSQQLNTGNRDDLIRVGVPHNVYRYDTAFDKWLNNIAALPLFRAEGTPF